MKNAVKRKGRIAHASVRATQLRVDEAERTELARLARQAGLLDATPLRALGD